MTDVVYDMENPSLEDSFSDTSRVDIDVVTNGRYCRAATREQYPATSVSMALPGQRKRTGSFCAAVLW